MLIVRTNNTMILNAQDCGVGEAEYPESILHTLIIFSHQKYQYHVWQIINDLIPLTLLRVNGETVQNYQTYALSCILG